VPLTQTIPALPVREVRAAVAAYVDRFGFVLVHEAEAMAVLRRDGAELHLWLAGDDSWTTRTSLGPAPVRSGAESFLAGTANCRIQVDDVAELDALYTAYAAAQVLHPVSAHEIETTDFGTREFHTTDVDGNLLSFFVRLPA